MEASPDPEWDAGRVGVAYEQARTVVDAQERTLQDIDDKAVRIVRVTVVLFGVLVSAVGLLDSAAVAGPLVYAGGGCLLLSLCLGVVTFAETDLHFGPRSQYLRRLVTDDFEDPDAWEQHLVQTYATWIEDNATTVRTNAWFLLATQVALISGVVLVTIGVLF